MAETEVESILREIRERVLSQQRAGKAATAASARLADHNGAAASEPTPQIRLDDDESLTSEKLSLINSYLATTARTWDRLPPLISNRSGLTASVELWIKRQLKRGSRWFTWEQVNFNAAVHQALRELLTHIAKADARQMEIEQDQATLTTKLAELQAGIERQGNEVGARFAELVSELRERDERLQAEQRVCFKQLALETSEAGALEDCARRKTEALLAELQRRVSEMEKK